jgi:hypothetical protein
MKARTQIYFLQFVACFETDEDMTAPYCQRFPAQENRWPVWELIDFDLLDRHMDQS